MANKPSPRPRYESECSTTSTDSNLLDPDQDQSLRFLLQNKPKFHRQDSQLIDIGMDINSRNNSVSKWRQSCEEFRREKGKHCVAYLSVISLLVSGLCLLCVGGCCCYFFLVIKTDSLPAVQTTEKVSRLFHFTIVNK